jgi:hypothetical protein
MTSWELNDLPSPTHDQRTSATLSQRPSFTKHPAKLHQLFWGSIRMDWLHLSSPNFFSVHLRWLRHFACTEKNFMFLNDTASFFRDIFKDLYLQRKYTHVLSRFEFDRLFNLVSIRAPNTFKIHVFPHPINLEKHRHFTNQINLFTAAHFT